MLPKTLYQETTHPVVLPVRLNAWILSLCFMIQRTFLAAGLLTFLDGVDSGQSTEMQLASGNILRCPPLYPVHDIERTSS